MKKFDQNEAEVYDQSIANKVPGYEETLKILALKASAEVPQNGRVLVLGAGTGAEIFILGNLRSDISFVAVDYSKEMLDQIVIKNTQRVEPLKIEIHCSSINEFTSSDLFDGIFCILTLHFLDVESKAGVFQLAYRLLKDHGSMWTYDLMEFLAEEKIREEREFLEWCYRRNLSPIHIEKLIEGLRSKFLPVTEGATHSFSIKAGFQSMNSVSSFPRFRGYENRK